MSINRLIGSVGDNKIVDHIQFIPSSNISVLNFVFTLNWIKYIQIGKYILGDTNKILHLLLNDWSLDHYFLILSIYKGESSNFLSAFQKCNHAWKRAVYE